VNMNLALNSLLRSPLKPRCAACDYACDAPDAVLCDDCHALTFKPMARCKCCALPIEDLATHASSRCGACLTDAPAFDRTQVAANFDAQVRSVLHRFKFHAQPGLAPWMARELAAHCHELGTDAILIPVPLSKQRLRERGYNQSLEIAKQLSVLTGLALRKNDLLRTRHTPAQSTLSLKARRASVKGAFACTERLDGLPIVVVDDVMTSGATLQEIALTLKKAGAAQVTNAVVFRAILEGA
jgi:ComF family protein